MQKIYGNHIWILLLFCLATFSCSKKKVNHGVTADVKAAFNYQPGTYWIYEDTVSGETDSVYVVNNSAKNISSNSLDYTYDLITINLSNSWNFILWGNTVEFQVPYDYDPFVVLPFKKGPIYNELLGGANDTAEIINIFDNYIANGLAYSNVAEVIHLHRQHNQYYSLDDTFFVNNSAGIITMILNHPKDAVQRRVWLLKRQYVHIYSTP